MLSSGSTGNLVVNLQQALYVCAYSPGPIDGIYGPQTTAAVVRMQAWHGIAQDGIYGPISEGCLTSEIKHYQAHLGMPQDGIASYAMQNAVRAFQAAHPPLAVDGIIGHYTDAAFDALEQVTPPAPPTPPAPIIAVAHRPWMAFNNDQSDKSFETNLISGWISYQFPLKMIIDKYMVKAPNNGNEADKMPKDWMFHAFNGANWILLDTQVDQIAWSNNEERVFTFSNATPYPLYRLKWTKNNGAPRTKIDQLAMYYRGGV